MSGKEKAAQYIALAKPRLSSSVVFSAVAGYLIAAYPFDLLEFIYLVIGGFLVVASSNAFNQIWERDRDALMQRTKNRPLPSGQLSLSEAIVAASVYGLIGAFLLFLINPLSAGFGLLSVLLYVLVYTPMKAKGPWAVFVGAIPGAIPFMLGWVAARNDFDIESGTLFAIQFIWQFPHFWAIGWMLHEDYARAGYNLLPTGKRDASSALQAFVYTFALLPLSLLPAFGLTGTLVLSPVGALLILVLGIFLIIRAGQLLRFRTEKAARRLMLGSVLWLTLMQIVFVLDRYLI
ncbi:MAG: Protoheme IX farnesyltransferase 1 [Flavobacteriia bacterium]|nr:MAG: Protoheme IX farnesyltransferase 1 [Flavobacteriia bacterium]